MDATAHTRHLVTVGDMNGPMLEQLVEVYPKLIEQVSSMRGSKSSQSLKSLDSYRYDALPEIIQSRLNDPGRANGKHGYLDLDELKTLLEWKMSRGVFRPSLRGLLASNPNELVQNTTAEAFQQFQVGLEKGTDSVANSSQALKTLCKLRGVGPATASLILSVAFPTVVPFFADELFAWISFVDMQQLEEFLKKKSAQSPTDLAKSMRVDKLMGIKYTEAEYKILYKAVMHLQQSLGSEQASATDIEKAAYVVLQGSATPKFDLRNTWSTHSLGSESSGPASHHTTTKAETEPEKVAPPAEALIEEPHTNQSSEGKRKRNTRSSTEQQRLSQSTRLKRQKAS